MDVIFHRKSVTSDRGKGFGTLDGQASSASAIGAERQVAKGMAVRRF